MTNKRVLSKAVSELDKAKAPAKSKDIIYDPMGQWKYPGENTRIPGNDITMQGVDYPVWAQPNVGPGTMMVPGQEYNFPEADYVDEYPQMRRGGSKKSKKFTRNIMATNRIFAENYLFKKPGKKQIYDPNAPLFEEGGETNDYIDIELTEEEIQAYRDGGYIVEDISVPQLTQAQNGILTKGPKPNLSKVTSVEEQINNLANSPRLEDQQKLKQLVYQKRIDEIYHPEKEIHKYNSKSKPKTLEKKINLALGNPSLKGALVANSASDPTEDPTDNLRHPSAARYTAEAIKDKTGNIPYVSAALGYLGANALGIGHEAGTLFKDDRDWSTKLREAGEDIYNNAVGAKVGASDMLSEDKTDYLIYLSDNNLIPDGMASKNKKSNAYFKKSKKDKGSYKGKNKFAPGGAVDLNPETMKKYLAALKVQENNESTGLKKNKWYPYPSSEKGSDTIAYGHKLLPGEQKYYEGITTQQAEALAKKDVLEKQTSAKGRVDAKYGKGTFDKLPQDAQMLLVDYQYNVGLQKFPKFVEAVVKGDKTTMLKEYERTSDAGKLTKRNNWTKGIIDNLEYPVIEKPKKAKVASLESNNDYTEAELTPEEIEWYKSQGYIVEELN